MNATIALRVAFRALLRNTTRSFLTMLGVVIGVAAVIAMVSIGAGARAQVEASYATMGSNLLMVTNGSSNSGGSRGGSGSQTTLTWDDVDAIGDEIRGIRGVAPLLRSTQTVLAQDQTWTTSIQGTTPDYFDLRTWSLSEGRPFDTSEVDSLVKVAVLGQTVVDKLFGGLDPVGSQIRIRNVSFDVVGVLSPKGQSSWGQDNDDLILIPYSTFQAKISGAGRYMTGYIVVGASSTESLGTAERQIRELLRDRHHLSPKADDDFQIRNLAEMASAQQEGTNTITTLLAAIAAVSLLVGGIGIMNIMLVSVTERTREIGLRMAVGARPRDILAQFLVEALVLSALGGVAGVGIGVLAAKRLAASFQWPLLVNPSLVVGVVAFSAGVGVVFGMYPAWKASRLDPIDALRFE
jgi:putative ABC transport system permease protein